MGMKRGLLPLLLLLAACAREAPPETVACPDPVAGCTVHLDGAPVTLRFSERPRPLVPFDLRVEGKLAPGARVRLDMAGMDMGLNVYRLETDEKGVPHARIILPVCVQGRADWRLTLESSVARASLEFSSL
jgi:hypothetical protein